MMNTRSATWLIPACVLAIAGCATHLKPLTPGTIRALTGAEIPPADRQELLNRSDTETWLLVMFSSNQDYVRLLQRKQMTMRVTELLCVDGKVVREIMSSPLIPGPADPSFVSATSGNPVPTGRFVYRTYFRVLGVRRADAGWHEPGPADGYDLHSETKDLCIKARGGNMIGQTAETDVAVIPHGTVRAALESGGVGR